MSPYPWDKKVRNLQNPFNTALLTPRKATPTTYLVGGYVAEALRRVHPALPTRAPWKWGGEEKLCLGVPLLEFQFCVALDKVGNSLSFSFFHL